MYMDERGLRSRQNLYKEGALAKRSQWDVIWPPRSSIPSLSYFQFHDYHSQILNTEQDQRGQPCLDPCPQGLQVSERHTLQCSKQESPTQNSFQGRTASQWRMWSTDDLRIKCKVTVIEMEVEERNPLGPVGGGINQYSLIENSMTAPPETQTRTTV